MYYIHTNPDTDACLLVFFLRFTFHIKFFENWNKQRYDFSKKVTYLRIYVEINLLLKKSL